MAVVAQSAERRLVEPDAAGSNPVDRPNVCDECDGRGEYLDAPGNALDGGAYWERCHVCDGTGQRAAEPGIGAVVSKTVVGSSSLSGGAICPSCASSDLAKIKGCVRCLKCGFKEDCNGF